MKNETVHPLTSGEILEFGAAVMQQLARNLDPARVRHFLSHKKELGAVLCEFCAKPLAPDIVRIDRSKPVVYPDGLVQLYTNLPAGPSEFSLDSLEQWVHDDQKTGRVTGNFLHKHLVADGMLSDCLGLVELLEIQKLGIATFRSTSLARWYSVGEISFGIAMTFSACRASSWAVLRSFCTGPGLSLAGMLGSPRSVLASRTL